MATHGNLQPRPSIGYTVRALDPSSAQLAVVMSGGGARSAYQAGFLGAVAEQTPDLDVSVVTGVSAGAINAAFLGTGGGDWADRTRRLEKLWSELEVSDVFRVGASSILPRALWWGLKLATGRLGRNLHLRGLVDTSPLAETLSRHLDTARPATGRGCPRTVAVTSSCYSTGESVTWIQGCEIENWKRAGRRGERVQLGVEHIMASAALPLFFPAVRVDGEWYADGGMRLTAPLSPAIHLGATKILAISTRAKRPPNPLPDFTDYPPPAVVLGSLLGSIFLDQFDADALRLERINALIEHIEPADRDGLRPVELLVLRPSQDLGKLANEYEARLPKALRFLTRGLGTKETRSNDLLSLIMFQGDYASRLIELGRKDAEDQRERIRAFLA